MDKRAFVDIEVFMKEVPPLHERKKIVWIEQEKELDFVRIIPPPKRHNLRLNYTAHDFSHRGKG